MESIEKLYDIDAQLKALEQEKYHRCLNMPYKMYNIGCKNPITYEYNLAQYYSSGMFPESNEVYVWNNISGNNTDTYIYSNSIQDLFEYAHKHHVKEFGRILIGFGDDKKQICPSAYYFTGDSDSFEEDYLDKGEELEKAFMYIIEKYKLLDDKLYLLIESLDPDNILMVEQLLIGMNKEL